MLKRMTTILILGAALVLAATPTFAGDEIPARPEELKFPELKYDPPRAKDYRVKLDDGMVAYMAPDRSLPLLTIHVLMRLGPGQDPAGQEGLGRIMVNQLTRGGAGELSAVELEDRVAALGARLSSGMGGGRRGMMGMGGVRTGPTESYVSLNLLAKDLEAGLELLVACLKEPAFQEDRLQLVQEQQLQRMKERNDETSSIERREWSSLVYGPGHWSTRWTTEASVTGIGREDLAALHRRYVGPENFLFAVSGNFQEKELKKALNKAFADWPWQAERPEAPAAPTAAPPKGWFAVEKEVNQARVSFGLPSIDRFDDDWYAALVMNDILGAGGFSSRLVNRIRSDEGLAYSVRSSLGSGTYYPDFFRVTFQTKVRSTAFAVSIALEEINRVRDELVSEEELELAKASFIQSLPAGFETAGSIAGALAMEEMTGRYDRDPEYFRKYRDRVAEVSREDVQRVARRLLDIDGMTFLVVGDLDEAMIGDPKHEASIQEMAGSEPTRIPLRDPMTMKPMAN